MASSNASLELDQRIALEEFEKDPSLIVTSGLCYLVSTFHVDEYGRYIQASDEEIKKNQKWYRPMPNQRRFIDYRKICRHAKKSVDAIVLKPRFIGATTDIQADFACRTVVGSGRKSLTVAHKTQPAQGIYKMQRSILLGLPEWMRPELINDSARMTTFTNACLNVSDSGSMCTSSTSIDGLHGLRFMYIHLSEYPRFENEDEVEQSLGGLLYKTPESQIWREGTANGKDRLFYPEFMRAWEAQGFRNYWQPGHKWFNHSTTAFFFAGYQDPGKRLPMPPKFTATGMVALLDDYEKSLLQEHIIPFWVKEHKLSAEQGMFNGIQYLCWRRARLPFLYPSWVPYTPDGNPGTPYSSITLFHRQEPNTVEEAFETSAGLRVLSDDALAWLKTQTEEPTRKGFVRGKEFIEDRKQEFVWVWVPPNDGQDVIAAYDGATGLANPEECRTDRDPNYNTDFSYGVIFDARTGEQLAELCTQLPQHLAAVLWMDLVMWYCKPGFDRTTPDKWPYLSWESQIGKQVAELTRLREYPLGRMYLRTDEDRLNRTPEMRYGWYKSKNTTMAAVQEFQRRIESHQLIPRSKRIYRQAGFFQEKENSVFQAAEKGKGTEASKDDGIVACMQLCAAWHYGAPTQVPVFNASGAFRPTVGPDDFDPTKVYALEPGAVTGENVGPAKDALRAMLALNLDSPSQLKPKPGSGTRKIPRERL